MRSIFESFFPDQIETDKKIFKKKRCGMCDACHSPDCGKCSNCKNMIKFGGAGKSKQACQRRRCPNMAVEEADLFENEDEKVIETVQRKEGTRRKVNEVKLLSKPPKVIKTSTYYLEEIAVLIGNINLTLILVNTSLIIIRYK